MHEARIFYSWIVEGWYNFIKQSVESAFMQHKKRRCEDRTVQGGQQMSVEGL